MLLEVFQKIGKKFIFISPIKVIFNSPDTTDEIPEVNRSHTRPEYLVICYEQIIRWQINTLKQRTGTEHSRDLALTEHVLDSHPYCRGQVANMIGDAFFDNLGKIVVSMHFVCDVS